MAEKQILSLKSAPRLEQVGDEHSKRVQIANIALNGAMMAIYITALLNPSPSIWVEGMDVALRRTAQMLLYVAAYVAALLLFAGIDVLWLTTMGAALYRSTLGDILLETVRIPPAIAFYLLYPLGIVLFAVMPALRSGSPGTALLYGALFGVFTYATYDLTNFATLRNWTLKIAVIDVIYGAGAVGVVSVLVYLIAHWLDRSAL